MSWKDKFKKKFKETTIKDKEKLGKAKGDFKQSFHSAIESYKQYKVEAPLRREAKIKRLEEQLKVDAVKEKLRRLKAKKRQKTTRAIRSGFETTAGTVGAIAEGFSMFVPPEYKQKQSRMSTPRGKPKRRKKKKGRRKVYYFYE